MIPDLRCKTARISWQTPAMLLAVARPLADLPFHPDILQNEKLRRPGQPPDTADHTRWGLPLPAGLATGTLNEDSPIEPPGARILPVYPFLHRLSQAVLDHGGQLDSL